MKRLIVTLSVSLIALTSYAQWRCSFTHYSSVDGLSQNSVMSILEDKKGFMWFATWDGLNKFDGYTFRTYKASENNSFNLTNNRIDYIAEDSLGYIWVQAYNSRVYRFNPATETFRQVPEAGKESNLQITSMRILDDKRIWLLTENEGAVRVVTDAGTHEPVSEVYSLQSGRYPSMVIHDVCLDTSGNEWLLTGNGIGMIAPGASEPVLYFVDAQVSKNRQQQPFFCMAEGENDVYLGSSLGRIWLFNKASQSFRLQEFPTQSDIVAISPYMKNKLIVATRNDGFFTYDPAQAQIAHYTKSATPGLPGNKIRSVYVDRFDEVWFDLEDAKGVTHFNPNTKRVKQEMVKVEVGSAHRSQPIFFIHEDVNGYLWVHPYDGGLSVYDRENDVIRPFYNELGADDWRFSNKLHSIMSDRQGNLWMCTHSKGLEKVTFLPERFILKVPNPLNYESLSNDIRSICQDNKGRLWMGLRDGKIRLYENDRYVGHLAVDGSISKTAPAFNGVAYKIIQDSKGRIWFATKGNGLLCAEEDGAKFRLTVHLSDPGNLYTLSDNNLYGMHEDRNGRLWVVTFGGGLNYMEEQEDGSAVFINHQNNLKGYPIDECYRARFVTSDSKGNIWVGTTSGAVTFKDDFSTPEDIRFRHFKRIPDDNNSLSNNDVYWIMESSDKDIYLATFGGGLNKFISVDEDGKAHFEIYTATDGLPSDVLLSMQEDAEKNLWISTENGLCKFIPSEKRADRYNDKSLDIRAGFNEASSVKLADGRLMFGTSNGFLLFSPEQITKSDFIPPITFSRLLINNNEIRPGKKDAFPIILDDAGQLTLSHKENTLTLQYSAMDMKAPENIQYAYMLEGLDSDWSYVDKQRVVTYTNLSKGNYIFKVRSTNNDGVWVNNTRSLPITILPSFWETPFAYFLYVLGILGIIFIAVYILFTIYRLKHEVSVEQQVSDIKLRFFTNVSHELRTPLTLIAGPVEYVLKNTPLTPEAKEQLELVEKNTDRMLRLVNQILDFRKIQNKKMKMKVQRVELIRFTRGIMDNFEALADEHDIDFIFESEKEPLYLWADVDHLEKIIFNLLSNAFKYTPVGKIIKVYVQEDEKTISLGVQDQGIGIAANKKESLFVRFENLMDKNLFNQSSSGIGLSLIKELAELHKANITVDSTLGEGSTFLVTFIKGKEHFDESVEFIVEDYVLPNKEVKAILNDEEIAPGQTLLSTGKGDDSVKDVMLLVEDNDELRSFLRTIFASSFRIVEARNGDEGVEKAISLLPDIIISDVMMGDKDGIQLTKELRDNLSTSHIPIILLTAKSTLESKLEGLEYGANDYITKPFSSAYLKARVENLLMQHQKLQKLYRTNLMSTLPEVQDSTPTNEMSPNDRKFIDKLVELMESNMDNGELIVDDLVQELSVSRSVFFKKLKALTGLAPIEFIKEMRVKRAAELILTGEYNISQISYMVGINDPRYFSKCFKQKYGMTPTEYKEQKIHPNSQNIHITVGS